MTVLPWKPLGRGRHFERQARGLARRLRVPFVRRTLWEYDQPEAFVGRPPVSYAAVWTSNTALANASFACTCHKGPRYSRKGRGKVKWPSVRRGDAV